LFLETNSVSKRTVINADFAIVKIIQIRGLNPKIIEFSQTSWAPAILCLLLTHFRTPQQRMAMTITSPPELNPRNGALPSTTVTAQAADTPKMAAAPPTVSHTVKLITAMMKTRPHISDLIFSPGRLPQIEVDGQLVELAFSGLNRFSPDDTIAIARDRNQTEQSGNRSEGHRVAGSYRIEQTSHGSCNEERHSYPDENTDRDDFEDATQSQPQDISLPRAQGHAQPKLVCTLGYRVGNHSVDTDRRQKQS
jgi:hypothetical protein